MSEYPYPRGYALATNAVNSLSPGGLKARINHGEGSGEEEEFLTADYADKNGTLPLSVFIRGIRGQTLLPERMNHGWHGYHG